MNDLAHFLGGPLDGQTRPDSYESTYHQRSRWA